MTTTKTYACPHCPQSFTNYVRRYQHVRDHHPERRTDHTQPTARQASESRLKRPTDIWPTRP